MLLSDRFMGYSLILANPKDFYHEVHRASHFIKFVKNDNENENETNEMAEFEDVYA